MNNNGTMKEGHTPLLSLDDPVSPHEDYEKTISTPHQDATGTRIPNATKSEPTVQSGDDAVASDSNNRSYWGRFNLPEAIAHPIPDNEPDLEMGGVPIAHAKWDDREVRHAFIRKVYSILGAQMLVTFGVCSLMSLHKATQTYVLQNFEGLFFLAVFLSFVLLCALLSFKNSYPTNMVLLGVWTVVEAYLVGTVTAAYASAGASGIVLEAVFITASVFLALTVYTLQTKRDFSFLEAGLGMCLWVLVLWSFLGLFIGFRDGYVFALFGSVVFSGYIIFDTWMLTEKLDPDEYIIAVIQLYLDIINLFLYILKLLSLLSRGNRR